MSDLSRLLGDVYGNASPSEEDDEAVAPAAGPDVTIPGADPERDVDDPPEARVELAPEPAPGWADDRLLDEAFADWVPGPGPHATGAERGWSVDAGAAVTGRAGSPTAAVPSIDEADDWLLPHDDESGLHLLAPDATGDDGYEGHVPEGPWSREVDDLLPAGRRSRRLALRRR